MKREDVFLIGVVALSISLLIGLMPASAKPVKKQIKLSKKYVPMGIVHGSDSDAFGGYAKPIPSKKESLKARDTSKKKKNQG